MNKITTPPVHPNPVRIFISAGEPSGDLLGGYLLPALHQLSPVPLELVGVGGPRMVAAGLRTIFPMQDISHMGLVEVLAHLPTILRRLHQAKAALRQQPPAALVTIDSPDFSFRLARAAVGLPVRRIHYVAPTVWAWRPERAKKIAKFYEYLLTLLPFEPPYFVREGLPTTHVGHPLVQSGAGHGQAARFWAQHAPVLGPSEAGPLLLVLAGSRQGELARLLPIFAATIANLKGNFPKLRVVVPTLPHWQNRLQAWAAQLPVPALVVTSDPDKYDAMAAAASHGAALACSGTVALELALANLPAVIAYRLHPLTAWLVKRAVRVKYANLVNLMHDRMVVPEYLQAACNPTALAAGLAPLLQPASAAAAAQRRALQSVAAWLGAGGEPPAQRAARVILQEIGLSPRST